MATVYHPTLKDVSNEVDESAVQDWQDSGWLLADPHAEAKTSESDAGVATATTSSGESASASSARRRATGSAGSADSGNTAAG